MPPEGARARLEEALASARDRMTVTWLAHGGFRVGELCGLHLSDLHLREAAGCGECRAPHVRICHREANPNRARAKTKHEWRVEDGTVCGGLVRRASPAMMHSYFEYMTAGYPADAGHGMLLVQLHGPNAGQPRAPAGVRGMLRRAGIREEIGRIRPHQRRHWFTTSVLGGAAGNALIARDAGGWASATTVEQVYGHADVHDPAFEAALAHVWNEGQGQAGRLHRRRDAGQEADIRARHRVVPHLPGARGLGQGHAAVHASQVPVEDAPAGGAGGQP